MVKFQKEIKPADARSGETDDNMSAPNSPTLSQISVSSRESVSSTSTGGAYHGVVGRMELKSMN